MKIISWIFRILFAGLFLLAAGIGALGIYTLSAEDSTVSGSRSAIVTERLQQEVQEHLTGHEQSAALVDRVKAFVITHSPYGSNWNANIRKLAHFSLYFALGSVLYFVLSILKAPWWLRWSLPIFLCGGYAILDEMHQNEVAGRVMSGLDVIIDTAGAFTSVTLLTIMGRFFHWLGH